MVTYSRDFHENIRLSKTLSGYQEQPYPLFYILIHLKNACNIRRIFMEQSIREYSYIQYSRNVIWNIPRNFIGIFFRILWEYIMGMFHEYSTNNFPGTLFENIPWNFIGNFFRIFWENIMGMFHEYSTNIYFPSRKGYQCQTITVLGIGSIATFWKNWV